MKSRASSSRKRTKSKSRRSKMTLSKQIMSFFKGGRTLVGRFASIVF